MESPGCAKHACLLNMYIYINVRHDLEPTHVKHFNFAFVGSYLYCYSHRGGRSNTARQNGAEMKPVAEFRGVGAAMQPIKMAQKCSQLQGLGGAGAAMQPIKMAQKCSQLQGLGGAGAAMQPIKMAQKCSQLQSLGGAGRSNAAHQNGAEMQPVTGFRGGGRSNAAHQNGAEMQPVTGFRGGRAQQCSPSKWRRNAASYRV